MISTTELTESTEQKTYSRKHTIVLSSIGGSAMVSQLDDQVEIREESRLIHRELTNAIIAGALDVHRELGPGLLESAYQACICHELARRGLHFQSEVPLPIDYKGVHLDCGYRMDLVVEKKIAVELKSIEKILPIHQAQLLTYMRLSHLRVGLLINFNVRMLRQGILRRIL